MNPQITSRKEIISVCTEMVQKNGISSINMRSVAAECGISVGALYNYFESKSDLLCSVTEGIWMDIFDVPGDGFSSDNFIKSISYLFESIDKSARKYPQFILTHAVAFAPEDKSAAVKSMSKYIQKIKNNLIFVLLNDSSISPDAFDENMTAEIFVDFIFELFISNTITLHHDYRGILKIAEKYLY